MSSCESLAFFFGFADANLGFADVGQHDAFSLERLTQSPRAFGVADSLHLLAFAVVAFPTKTGIVLFLVLGGHQHHFFNGSNASQDLARAVGA